jgi:TGS domain
MSDMIRVTLPDGSARGVARGAKPAEIAAAIGPSFAKAAVRQGVLVQEQDEWYVSDTVADDTETGALRSLQQGSIVYRIAFGPRAGRKMLTLREALPIDTEIDYESKPLCVNEQGFSLHAAVLCHATERLKLERLQ